MNTLRGMAVLVAVVALVGCASDYDRQIQAAQQTPIHAGPAGTYSNAYSGEYNLIYSDRRADVGDLQFYVRRVWNANRINPETLGLSRRGTNYVMVNVGVWNSGRYPESVPAPHLIDKQGRAYEISQDGFLACDSMNGTQRINPQQPLITVAAFALPTFAKPDGLAIVFGDKSVPLD